MLLAFSILSFALFNEHVRLIALSLFLLNVYKRLFITVTFFLPFLRLNTLCIQ